jgi:hypothetical protein
MYTIKIEFTQENSMELLQVSQFLRIDKLFEEVETYVVSHLEPDSVIWIFTEAKRLQSKNLETACLKFIGNRAEEVLASKSVSMLTSEDMSGIIGRDELVSSETSIWDFVVRWGRTSGMEGEEEGGTAPDVIYARIKPLLPFIRFHLIPVKKLVETIQSLQILPVEAMMEIYRSRAQHLEDLFTTGADPSAIPAEPRRKMDIFMRTGVFVDIPVQDLTGWMLVYKKPFSHATDLSVFKMCHGSHVLVAGKRADRDDIIVGAIGEKSEILTETGTNECHPHNGAYWYHIPKKSFGFSADGNVKHGFADVEPGRYRLSIHLDGRFGGFRCGTHTQLNTSSEFEKLIFWANPSTGDDGKGE